MSAWRTWRRKQLPKIAPVLQRFVRWLGNTLRFESDGWEKYRDHEGPIIFCSWHGRSMLGTVQFRDLGYWVIISNSRDGEMQNTIFSRFGFRTIRGSTGREGVRAAIEAIRVLKEGDKMALTPDGPRGPSGEVQEGILMMAQKSGAWIVPIGNSAARRWIVKSWDKYMVPKPYSRAIMVFGEPITVPKDADEAVFAAKKLELKQGLDSMEAEADRRMGHG